MAIQASVYFFRKRKNNGIKNIENTEELFNKFNELLNEVDVNDVMVWAAPMFEEEIEDQVESFLEEEIAAYGYDNVFEALRTWLVEETEHGKNFLENYYTLD